MTLIMLFGSECESCGFEFNDENSSAAHFHHVDPKAKSFGLDNSNLLRNWDNILMEAKKCQLICCNCHSILHQKMNQEWDHEQNQWVEAT